MSDQWSEIAPSEHPGIDNVRRVESRYPLDFRRGKDFRGRYIFILEGRSDEATFPPGPKLGGIDVATTFGADGSCKLVLTLLDPVYLEIFRVLCHDLLSVTSGLLRGDNNKGLILVLERLSRWQELLKRGHDQILTRPQIIGLIGELFFLRDVVMQAIGTEAISTWRGPFGDEQDFVYGNWILEIKTQLSTADQRLQISSEAQLDTSSGNILVCHQTLGASSADDPLSRSLNDAVDEIRRALAVNNSPVRLDFELALIEASYRNRPDYDVGRWILSSRTMYAVSEGFPRIVPQMLGDGVERVTYHVRTDACLAFKVDIDAAVEQVFGRRD